jgi:hypothetical protein
VLVGASGATLGISAVGISALLHADAATQDARIDAAMAPGTMIDVAHT